MAIERVLHIDIDITQESVPIDITIDEGTGGGKLPYYEGAYEVTPRKVEQILATKDKSMSDNVTVEAIHYAEVENPSGGKTIIVGFE